MEQDQNLLESILRAIVNHPDEVQVTRHVDEMGVLLSAKLGEGDAGVVIGKDGRAIKAIRSVMNLVGRRSKARVSVRLDVPDLPRNAGSESASA
ncbi:MAG: KH domain-containing protein [Candidatus Yanofskybacteria bacterium]|nr:KH domain-containing protein [Candidatus Yanofskybacteria bacterium]